MPSSLLPAAFPQRRRHRLTEAALISFAMLLPACALQAEAPSERAVAGSSTSAVRHAIDARLASPDSVVAVGGQSYPTAPLQVFYQSRGNAPVWVDGHGPNSRGAALMAAFADAKRDGLDPSLYRVGPDLYPAGSAEALADLELGLSTALVRYANDVSIGRAALRPPDPDLRVTPKTVDPTATLMAAADAPDEATFVADLAPGGPLYQGLRLALDRYRKLDQSGVWAPCRRARPCSRAPIRRPSAPCGGSWRPPAIWRNRRPIRRCMTMPSAMR